MNPFTTIPAYVKVFYQVIKYNSFKKEFDKLRAAEDYEGERALILEKTGLYIGNIAKTLGVDFDVEGYENVPESGPVIIYSNHQGYADVLALFAALRKFQIGFVAKDEFRSWGPIATGINYTRSIFLVRGGGREALKSIKEAVDLTSKGFSLCIFPEGTRSRKQQPGEFKDGAFKFAQKANVPVLPVTIDGSYKMYEIDGSFHHCTIKVKFHPLVHIEEMDRHQQKEAWPEIIDTIVGGLELEE